MPPPSLVFSFFPYTTLFRSQFLVIFVGGMLGVIMMRFAAGIFVSLLNKRPGLETAAFLIVGWVGLKLTVMTLAQDRKSTRLNSSHVAISYAVFCLKKIM